MAITEGPLFDFPPMHPQKRNPETEYLVESGQWRRFTRCYPLHQGFLDHHELYTIINIRGLIKELIAEKNLQGYFRSVTVDPVSTMSRDRQEVAFTVCIKEEEVSIGIEDQMDGIFLEALDFTRTPAPVFVEPVRKTGLQRLFLLASAVWHNFKKALSKIFNKRGV